MGSPLSRSPPRLLSAYVTWDDSLRVVCRPSYLWCLQSGPASTSGGHGCMARPPCQRLELRIGLGLQVIETNRRCQRYVHHVRSGQGVLPSIVYYSLYSIVFNCVHFAPRTRSRTLPPEASILQRQVARDENSSMSHSMHSDDDEEVRQGMRALLLHASALPDNIACSQLEGPPSSSRSPTPLTGRPGTPQSDVAGPCEPLKVLGRMSADPSLLSVGSPLGYVLSSRCFVCLLESSL